MDTNSRAFPLFIPLTDCKVVVVGGGRIASRRINTLNQFRANIIVVSPHITEEIMEFVKLGKVEWLEREYRLGDVDGAKIVVTATNNREVNRQVGQDCSKLLIPVSVADSKEESTYYFPGVACEDSIVVGVTTSGTNHHLARRITDKIKNLLKSM
ncbi:precorrin-2 dehydrogenase/sirohydrochlorin ferrochelatase family protein [Anaerosporobacter faecicola]|uniref:precorrin-2 dehydrogenase/sirohydrochlorin ferrochelatase family protein n=1 Tax=Anaerosporobacter faecicola TaxID=2718714 RepID=UPI0014397C92|nr:bifunctional precorrin-2 dehydrogenase/sirohydrochlorin ferrochelatase [Anaerosporobacter faecicola]